jgi:transposase
MQSKGAPRRRHGKELKARVLAACAEPGASVAGVAQAHGLNANLVHKWRRSISQAPQALAASVAEPGSGVFMPLQLPPRQATVTPPDIRIELRRGATSMTVSWPAEAASDCAVWMRELLR